jgi:hypothetical protein
LSHSDCESNGGAFLINFKLFEAEKTDLTIAAERLRELTNSLFGVISILKNPPENQWKLVL